MGVSLKATASVVETEVGWEMKATNRVKPSIMS